MSIFSKYCNFCSGNELIEADHDQSEVIKAKVDEVSQMWTDLVNSSEVKGVKLQEACQQQQYNRGIEDLELYMDFIHTFIKLFTNITLENKDHSV